MPPSTTSTFFISTLNEGLTSTLRYIGKDIYSTISYSSNIHLTGGTTSYPVVIQTPQIDIGSLSSLITSSNYTIYVESEYNIKLTTDDTFAYISTNGYFGEYADVVNEGYSYMTRVGSDVYTTIRTKLAFPYLDPTTVPRANRPANASTFVYSIFLLSSQTVSNPSVAYDIFIPAVNNFYIEFSPV
jgi:hypothetical protein